jgi:hypothetical protein
MAVDASPSQLRSAAAGLGDALAELGAAREQLTSTASRSRDAGVDVGLEVFSHRWRDDLDGITVLLRGTEEALLSAADAYERAEDDVLVSLARKAAES